MGKQIEFLINKSEITAGTRGASLGPEAIMAVARKRQSFLFGENVVTYIIDENARLDNPIKFPHAKRIEGLVEVYQRVCLEIGRSLEEDRFPIILAGDHGSAGGTIAGIKAHYPDFRLGVIWIDAHGDMHTPYTTPSGNMHGMPLATALGEDNLECQNNEISELEKTLWEKLKNTGVAGPKVLPKDLIFIGVRDTEPEEDELMERLGITNFKVSTVREIGPDEVLRLTLEQLKECDMIYVSFDVDSMDPQVTSMGTGTPVANGIMPEEAKTLLTGLAMNNKVICMEFVEVNPCLDDKTNKMAEVTFELLTAVVDELKQS